MWEVGEQVLDGRFRVVNVLPSGGLTEVYVAEQLSLARRVTLKVFRLPPAALAERFEEEVRRLATVEHPGVVRLIDSGRSESTLFLVNELDEGARLADELKGEPLLPERALELLTQIAAGLAAIHDKGLVHGDLRPGTVVLGTTARGEQTRLSDFGLGWLTESFALEQARPDVQSDLVALGALAYQMLAGTPPTLPHPKPLAEAAPHLADQAALCALVMGCLEGQPPQGPGAAAELARTLAKLPRPAEPTIFLETMQRPPPVPAAKSVPAAPPPLPPAPAPLLSLSPEGVRAAAAPVAAPRPLLASVMTMAMPQVAVAEVKAAVPAPEVPSRRWLPIAAGGAVLLVLIVGIVVATSGSAKREARKLIERRQPMQAMEIIGKAQRKLSAPDSELTALKVAGLHLTDAHADEAALFKSLGGADEALDPLVLAGLVEDFSKKEDQGLRTLLRGLPAKRLSKVLEAFVLEPLSPRQWGALRYLDLEEAAGSLNLVEQYSASLESSDCGARRAAARRLAVLMDDAAEPALNRLRDAPREGAEKSCGQDEAQAAIQALRKGR